MLHDRANIHVAAGAGGNGCMSFRREAHVPRGGPDGGDGGRGGEVVLVCDRSLRDLHVFRRKSHYHAGRGGHGEGALRHGAEGESVTIRVPPGTEARGADGGDLAGRRWELLADGQRAVIARGGSGGRGNKRFANATRQAPRFAEKGLPGEEGSVELRLRLLADVGLVGLPNAGKSSLLARMTRAAPKVAHYPFTTLSPVLGVIEGDERQLVVADIPGLIEGASEGAGLGHDFLAHVERTRVLVHVLDVAPQLAGDGRSDALANHATIERELAAHDERLARLPRVLALSKADLVTRERAHELVAQWERRLGPGVPVLATSSATGAGVAELAEHLFATVPHEQPGGEARSAAPGAAGRGTGVGGGADDVDELAEHMVFRPAARGGGLLVERVSERAFEVSGEGIERLIARHDVDNEDAMVYVEERLRKLGVLDALLQAGFVAGDDVRIAGIAFALDPGAPA
jgi:GTPase